jgi:YegS/Rv2252/BmrU family lipid kinase
MKLEALLIKTPKARLQNKALDGIETRLTEFPLHAREIAMNACLDGKTLLIASGGDGTVNEVTNGIFDAGANNKVALAILRSGSGNDFARILGIFSEKDSYDALRNRKSCFVDVGKATYINFNGKPESRIYCNFAGAGFDAETAKNVKKFRWAKRLDYFLSLSTPLLRFSPKPIRLQVDDQDFGEEPRYFVNLANGRYAGRGIKLAPNACINDGKLDLLIAGSVGKAEAFMLIPHFYAGTHLKHKKIKCLPAKKVKIEGQDLYVHLDGEVVGTAPATLEVVPLALNVFYLEKNLTATIPLQRYTCLNAS